jgi:mono/diheme cytochrome c family protein
MLVLLVVAWAACGSPDSSTSSEASSEPSAAASVEGLTPDEMEKGIGPVRQVSLGDEVEEELAERGEEIFTMKCTACHKFDQRYVGPPLGDVLGRRAPEYVMNMILNPAEMVQKHPEAKALLAQYLTPMPNQSLTEEEARAVLEYVRSQQQGLGGAEDAGEEADE